MHRTEEWTLIKDFRPPENILVSACCEHDGWIGAAYRNRDGAWYTGFGLVTKVTHWKSLPDAKGWKNGRKI